MLKPHTAHDCSNVKTAYRTRLRLAAGDAVGSG